MHRADQQVKALDRLLDGPTPRTLYRPSSALIQVRINQSYPDS